MLFLPLYFTKKLQLQGALPPDPHQGCCPWTPLGTYGSPQTPANFHWWWPLSCLIITCTCRPLYVNSSTVHFYTHAHVRMNTHTCACVCASLSIKRSGWVCSKSSGKGLARHMHPCIVQGNWSLQESALHIDLLELMAVERALDHWLPYLRNHDIQILSDNTTVCSYLLHQGGMKSRYLCSLAVRVVSKLHASKIHLSCRHIPGHSVTFWHPSSHGMDTQSGGFWHDTEKVSQLGGRYVCNEVQQSTPSLCLPFPRSPSSRNIRQEPRLGEQRHVCLFTIPPNPLKEGVSPNLTWHSLVHSYKGYLCKACLL